MIFEKIRFNAVSKIPLKTSIHENDKNCKLYFVNFSRLNAGYDEKNDRRNKNPAIFTLSHAAKTNVKIDTVALGAIKTAEYKIDPTPYVR